MRVCLRVCVCVRVFVPFFTRHTNRSFSAPYYAVIRILSDTTIFFYTISQKPGFSETIIEHKMCFDFLYNFVRIVSHYEGNSEYIIVYFHMFSCQSSVILLVF